MKFHIRDEMLADEGLKQIEWADWQMPVLRQIRERFEREKPLQGLRIGACLHVTKETANLMRTLIAGGRPSGAVRFQSVEHAGRCGGSPCQAFWHPCFRH